MKLLLTVLTTILACANASAESIPECFMGRWKSDEALTLQDMRKHPEVTEKAKILFENHFFGRLVLIIGPRYSGAYFDGERDSPTIPFELNDVVERGADWVTLRDRTLGIVQEQRWVCEEGRIYALVSKWQFKEYFSPLP